MSRVLFSLCIVCCVSVACGDRQGPPIVGKKGSGGVASGGADAEASGGTGSVGGGGAGSSTGGFSLGGGAALTLECPVFAEPVERSRPVGTLSEASGIALSRENTERLYAHNDSGDTARFFAFDALGAYLGQNALNLPQPSDWEDMAAYLDARGVAQLLFADMGDNSATRASIQMVRARDPASFVADATLDATTFELSYPDGARNAEALFVDERDQRAYILSKDAPTHIYSFSLDADAPALSYEGMPAHWPDGFLPSGADMFASLGLIVVRSPALALLFPVTEEMSVMDALARTPCELPLTGEATAGEAVAILGDGSLLTLAESGVPMHFYQRL